MTYISSLVNTGDSTNSTSNMYCDINMFPIFWCLFHQNNMYYISDMSWCSCEVGPMYLIFFFIHVHMRYNILFVVINISTIQYSLYHGIKIYHSVHWILNWKVTKRWLIGISLSFSHLSRPLSKHSGPRIMDLS